MNPVAMAALIIGLHLVFFYSAIKRFNLLTVGRFEPRFDRVGERLQGVFEYAFAQRKMHYYPAAGLAHQLIFLGFLVLLLNTLILWARGFLPGFSFFVFGPTQPLGEAYEALKETFSVLVLAGTLVFFYFRLVKKTRRMTLSGEALLILGIIATMMIADIVYDGSMLALRSKWADMGCGHVGEFTGICGGAADLIAPFGARPEHAEALSFHATMPAGSIAAMALAALPPSAIVLLGQAGFWIHATLVLIFLNILPYSKHFHILTAIPNVFFRRLDPPGKLPALAPSSDALMETVGAASEKADPLEDPVGAARIQHFTWKAVLDFYTCTECGRCSDNCPAHKTGKMLSPKQLTLDLRNYMYENQDALIERWAEHRYDAAERFAAKDGENEPSGAPPATTDTPVDIVPNIIHPDVLWACTTCRACEEQCPVMISYVDKIVSMRRNLVLVKGEFPAELQKPFSGMETNGNPWNLSRMDRAGWADGLAIATMRDKPQADVLYWVGCAASYDDRAKKIARATARLLKKAGVDFAILGEEETCTGDPARRAGNEYLFLMLAEQNAGTLNGYKDKGGVRTIVTACPHCFNTLANEYPDFGAKFEVVHHTDYLLGLVAQKKLVPKKAVKGKVAFHDSCYLGRYNGIYDAPREILAAIPGVELVEVNRWNKKNGLCCGAGGAQMWMEEQNKDRVNVKRTLQLVDTGASTIASACPFCMTMLTDGLKSQELEARIRQMDVAELLAESCLEADEKKTATKQEAAAAELA